MRILAVHNFYQQPGGEDAVFFTETQLLKERGHEVQRYTQHNDRLREVGRITSARLTIWNAAVRRELRTEIRRHQPDVIHFHNTFPLISPSAYYAAQAEGVAVVQTLHNYRLLCSNALLYRDGHVCEDCVGRAIPWPGIAHACYRGDRLASGVVVGMLTTHRALGTWRKCVHRFIALTDFAREEFIRGGLPADRIEVKPNFVHPDPGSGPGGGGYALFVGRLSEEKGLHTLIEAYRRVKGPPLRIVGDGPLAGEVEQAARDLPGFEWLGRQPAEVVFELLGKAEFLVLPSEWFEGFPRVAVEAMALGTPILASRVGALPEIMKNGRSGRLFTPEDCHDLANQFERMGQEAKSMRAAARSEFEARYKAEANYQILLRIYRSAQDAARARA
jgi:glycosyltransferase involved in cell wall biosynthesis